MSNSENAGSLSAIAEAIRAKRERKSGTTQDIEELEASLIADIENFDLDAAERRAKREYLANSGAGMADPPWSFPRSPPSGRRLSPRNTGSSKAKCAGRATADTPEASTSLLDQLRQQAEVRQREIHSALAERSSANEAIDQALKHLFFYLHELVQQLNIVKPGIPRDYPLIEKYVLNHLEWQEGFADYRTQSQSAGALVELVTFSYHLKGLRSLCIERDGPTRRRSRPACSKCGPARKRS